MFENGLYLVTSTEPVGSLDALPNNLSASAKGAFEGLVDFVDLAVLRSTCGLLCCGNSLEWTGPEVAGSGSVRASF